MLHHVIGSETFVRGLVSIGVILIACLLRLVLRDTHHMERPVSSARAIWARKFTRLGIGIITIVVLLAVWFPHGHGLALFSGLIGGGIAFASQNVILSIVGFFVIVFGRIFDIGHRVEFGGVRGDVLDIGLFKTTIMEMGVPAPMLPDPNHWISARQYTGRVVSVINAEVFKCAVYNYTTGFDLLWEEIRIPVRYGTDLATAERVLLDAARAHTQPFVDRGRLQIDALRRRYLIEPGDLEPRAFVRLTDNWIEIMVRFVVGAHVVRDIKDRIFRTMLDGLTREKIDVASTTVEIVRIPEPVRFERDG